MTKRTKISIFGVMLLTALVTGAFVKIKNHSHDYDKLTVHPEDFEVEVLATGTIRSENEVEVKAPIAGRVEKILVEEGQKVTRNQVLFYISSSERAALLDAARARSPEEYEEWTHIYNMTPVIAPISGTVIQRKFKPGQSFNPDNPILVISDHLTVKTKVDETDIGQVVIGQEAEITLDAFPNEVIIAKVDQIAFNAVTENGVTTYVVDVLPTKAPAFLRSGMTANVKIKGETRKNAIALPLAAVQNKGDQLYVLVENKQTQNLEEKVVKLGPSRDNKVEIQSGLKDGDVVMVKKFVPPEEN